MCDGPMDLPPYTYDAANYNPYYDRNHDHKQNDNPDNDSNGAIDYILFISSLEAVKHFEPILFHSGFLFGNS